MKEAFSLCFLRDTAIFFIESKVVSAVLNIAFSAITVYDSSFEKTIVKERKKSFYFTKTVYKKM